MPAPRSPRAGTARPHENDKRASSPHLHREPSSASQEFHVVGIGASAGGLDACRRFVSALATKAGMAFILVQHLDPTHESMMVNLLVSHTQMKVLQAADGMQIEPDHFYIIPPGAYLSVVNRVLHLSPPEARHGARLPFDFLLHSMAKEFGPRAVCIILSGTGADGSAGLRAVKDNGGLVIVQQPEEAGFDGMPRSAIATGVVDLVLPVAEMPNALVTHMHGDPLPSALTVTRAAAPLWLSQIIDLLRAKTAHDFRLYKHGTLQRRIERRMALANIKPDNGEAYLSFLYENTSELQLLAKDLLINVTSFFRDAAVFELLSQTVVPDLVREQQSDAPLRIWISGCSSGEEAYSLAIVFLEAIAASRRNIKLQVFASDVDPDAVATARDGTYELANATDISQPRLAKFFTKEERGYRVSPELRSTVTFTVQDVLVDPPFSRLDFVSCRNLLIYLGPEAQSKVLSLFHFALRENGILLLGSAETIGSIEGRFEIVSKAERIYRHLGRARPGDVGFSAAPHDGMRLPTRQRPHAGPSRQAALADLCRRRVLEVHAPAAVLIDRRQEILYSLGPINRYLRLATGHPTTDLLAMAHDGVRTKLRAVIHQATQSNKRCIVAGGTQTHGGMEVSFRIDAQPLTSDGEDLMLICFLEGEQRQGSKVPPAIAEDVPRIVELEQELVSTRAELQDAVRNLEFSSEEQRAINEEALSINEEYQSTNEELLTSKEELQSLNEELTALNGQLQETLEAQRTTADDLQNVLYSTDVATLFLDVGLRIRFFTPATKALFNVITSDVGRPLADLNSLSADRALAEDARTVLQNLAPIDREIETSNGNWFMRRILPYRTHKAGVEGVVITFTNITERKLIATALEAAKQQAERATLAKSRFLAAASHDLRQPLQTFALLQGLLAKHVSGDKAQKLVARLDDTLSAMTGMLDALLDINRIDAGTVRADVTVFPIHNLLDRMRAEFAVHAQSKKLVFHVVSCDAFVTGDPVLLEQMLRNLLSNALKYTHQGKILLGCRRHNGALRLEIWDTGIGIPETELQAIFEEYHQLDNAARERSRGLGLGLSIVRRLGNLTGAVVRVRSRVGKGSVFSIDLKLAQSAGASAPAVSPGPSTGDHPRRSGAILVVEDDPEVRDLLEIFLKGEGHGTAAAAHGLAALELVARGTITPDLIIADYNLPNHMDGLRLVAKLRGQLQRQIPVIILTGDISTDALREIAAQDCVQLNKPVKLRELTAAIGRCLAVASLLPASLLSSPTATLSSSEPSVVFVVDDDEAVRDALRSVLEDDGRSVQDFATCEAFLVAFRPNGHACVLIDAYLPGMSGLELLQRLRTAGHQIPAIMITGDSDVGIAVQAMKAGACDFIEKPIARSDLLECVDRALEQSRDSSKVAAWRDNAASHIAGLTLRERQVMELVLAGHPSKNIAADLEISQRTVENHRASIMKKTGAKSLPALARLALAAAAPSTEAA